MRAGATTTAVVLILAHAVYTSQNMLKKYGTYDVQAQSLLTKEVGSVEEQLFCNTNSNATAIFQGEKPESEYAGCFVSAIFGLSPAEADTPINVSLLREKYPNYEFLMFTNLVALEAMGWRKVLYFDREKRRMITLSRYPKFLSWKEDFVMKYCPVVFYLDAASSFRSEVTVDDFNKEKEIILQSEVGFQNNLYPVTSLQNELNKIVKYKKDTESNVDATRSWIMSQPDYASWENPTVYHNTWLCKYTFF